MDVRHLITDVVIGVGIGVTCGMTLDWKLWKIAAFAGLLSALASTAVNFALWFMWYRRHP